MAPAPRDLMERFMDYVFPEPNSGCWLWSGGWTSSGYGIFGWPGHTNRAHKAIWEILFGPVSRGLVVRHKCDVRCCVNPQHLILGTSADNSADMVSRGRAATGIRHGSHRFPDRWKGRALSEEEKAAIARRVSARAKLQTECKRGHALSGDNLYLSHGRRHCRQCRADRAMALR